MRLLEGLREKKRIGVNPYPFGFIGSTDTHMATPGAVSEYDTPYKFGVVREKLLSVGERPSEALSSGTQVGWRECGREENTRDAIFDALKNKRDVRNQRPTHRAEVLWKLGAWIPGYAPQPNFARGRLRGGGSHGRGPS